MSGRPIHSRCRSALVVALSAFALACASSARTQRPAAPVATAPSLAAPSATPRAPLEEIAGACTAHFDAGDPLHWWSFHVTCTRDDAATVKITVVRMEHDADRQIVSTVVEDLHLATDLVGSTRVEEGPERAHWVVVRAKAGRTFLHVHWKNEQRIEEQRAELRIPFGDATRAQAFANALGT